MDWDEIQNEFDRAYGMSCKPSGLQKYKAGHIFDENMSVKWNRDKLEEENKKFEDEVSRLNLPSARRGREARGNAGTCFQGGGERRRQGKGTRADSEVERPANGRLWRCRG